MMMRMPFFLLGLTLVVAGPASADSLESLCFKAVSTGDATINCQKAALRLQRKQLEVLLDIRRLIAKGTNRALAQTVTNTGLTVRRLEEILRTLAEQGARPSNALFVSDSAVLGGGTFSCDYDIAEECTGDARGSADALCTRLGYSGQQAHEFTGPEGGERTVRLKWVVCRP